MNSRSTPYACGAEPNELNKLNKLYELKEYSLHTWD
jgi:hypothetical protein